MHLLVKLIGDQPCYYVGFCVCNILHLGDSENCIILVPENPRFFCLSSPQKIVGNSVQKSGRLCDSLMWMCAVRLRNDLYCVEWGVKLYSLTHCIQYMFGCMYAWLYSCVGVDHAQVLQRITATWCRRADKTRIWELFDENWRRYWTRGKNT